MMCHLIKEAFFMFKIPVYSHYRDVPSYEDKRIHFDGVIHFTCPNCKKESTSEGNDFIYCPTDFPQRSHECDHCYEEDYILEIKDIKDGYVYLENIKPEWKVKFMKKIVTYEEIKEEA